MSAANVPHVTAPGDKPTAEGEETENLALRVNELELMLAELLAVQDDRSKTGTSINLFDQEADLGAFEGEDAHVLARPWFQNVHISGFGAFDYLDSGNAGRNPNGGFVVKETTLFIEAQVWEDTSFFLEFQPNWLAYDGAGPRVAEVYARFDDIFGSGVGAKFGRVDVPFGEEYLWQDAPDNPLIQQSAAYPYGRDEGLVLFGDLGESSQWVASLTDGTDRKSKEDHPAKAVTLKVSRDLSDELYVSASVLKNGDSAKSAIEFGGSHPEPVGAGGRTSTAGASGSEFVDALLWEVDAVYRPCERIDVAMFYGQGKVDDDDDAFDRDLRWFMLQPRIQLCPTVYAVLRYGEIGTYDELDGYHFDGKILAGGRVFGDDIKRLQRLSAGIGWQRNANTLFKFEVGQDWFSLIDTSPLQDNNSDRLYFGVEAVLSF